MLTVLVATRNGARTLPHVLEGYQKLLSPPGGWKLVIVDNASTDGTRDVVHRFRSSLPLTYCEEPRPGKNRALLTALREAEGDLFVFSDDDATPDPAWLVSLRRAADERADFDVFAGTIRPRWEVRPERWVLDDVDLAACYSITDSAQLAGPIRPVLVAGPNMAIRRRVFEQGYRFDPEVGPSGGDYAMGSETDLTVRLGEAGFKVWFCPEAVVEHFIRAHQIEPKWILERAIRFGRGTCTAAGCSGKSSAPGCGSASRAISAGKSPRKRCGILGRRVQASRELSRTMGAPPPSGLRHPGPAALQQPDATAASPGTQCSFTGMNPAIAMLAKMRWSRP